jgi:prepilin-type processing-associated H-X9-DG protein
VRRTSEVFLFADGNCPDPSVWYGYGVHAHRDTNESLFDGFLGTPQADFRRHRGRINVMFVDGHGETLMLPNPRQPIGPQFNNKGDLDRVGLCRGIYN